MAGFESFHCMRRLWVLLLAGALGCSSSTEVAIGGVVANAEPGQIAITNRTGALVYTFVLGRNASALVDWIPCSDPATCAGLEVGGTRRVPNPSSLGTSPPETEALVYWWHLVPAPGGGFKPDSIRVGVVRLR